MTEPPVDGQRPTGDSLDLATLDRELNYRAILYFTLGVTVVTVAATALMWILGVSFRARSESLDPPPPILAAAAEARATHRPPGPRLQTSPEEDMRLLKAYETEQLETYGWVDEERGVARIPVERAVELLASEGLSALDRFALIAEPDAPLDGTPAAPVTGETPDAPAEAVDGH